MCNWSFQDWVGTHYYTLWSVGWFKHSFNCCLINVATKNAVFHKNLIQNSWSKPRIFLRKNNIFLWKTHQRCSLEIGRENRDLKKLLCDRFKKFPYSTITPIWKYYFIPPHMFGEQRQLRARTFFFEILRRFTAFRKQCSNPLFAVSYLVWVLINFFHLTIYLCKHI